MYVLPHLKKSAIINIVKDIFVIRYTKGNWSSDLGIIVIKT